MHGNIVTFVLYCFMLVQASMNNFKANTELASKLASPMELATAHAAAGQTTKDSPGHCENALKEGRSKYKIPYETAASNAIESEACGLGVDNIQVAEPMDISTFEKIY